jgi:thermolysin
VILGTRPVGIAQQPASTLHLAVTTRPELAATDTYISQQQRAGALRVLSVDEDPSMPARTLERFQQFHNGVRIWDAQVVRDSANGVAQSIFGSLAPELTLSTDATLTGDQATVFLRGVVTGEVTMLRPVELTICHLDGDEYRLAYTAVVSGNGQVIRAFVDAHTGAALQQYSVIETQQAANGVGRGVLGDTKKVSMSLENGTYFSDDRRRPPALTTYDMRGDINRTVNVVERGFPLFASDRASDTDNDWQGVVVDAHTYVGWTYDFYSKRFARRGLDNRDRRLVDLINGVSQQGALTLPASLSDYAVNAFWCGDCGPGGVGLMYFGNGIPPEYYFIDSGQNIGYLAGSLDVVGHELTHGVTESTSNLNYVNESGALNEAFSDIMGTSIEFFYAASGDLGRPADYVIGADTVRGVRPGVPNGIRSMANPGILGDPDHYSRRYIGPADNGGVHLNATIVTHAFYLAVEGGTNRTSGLAVQGVGAANRDQMERVWYRAFAFLLPSSANFSTARAATIQAARDLYGAGSAAERAVTQAWAAVGVS